MMRNCLASLALISISVACATPTAAPAPNATTIAIVPTLASTITRAPTIAPQTFRAPLGNVPAIVPACPADINTPLFTTLPIDANDFLAFRPLGFLSPPIHMFPAKHSAFSMTPPGVTPAPKPVRAPGKVWVVEIWEASFSTGAQNYQLYFYPCREVRVYFGHVATISEKLKTEMKKVDPKCNAFFEGTATVTTCRHEQLSIALEAGEQFGTGPDSAGVDLGVADGRAAPAAFIKLDHYNALYPYWVAPLNYFTPESEKILASKTGHVFGTRVRTAEPIGGTFMQDIPGAAQGNWFLPGKNHRNSTDLSPFLGLARDYVEPAQPVMAIGTSIKGAAMGLYSFAPQAAGKINRDYNSVKADGNIYCYDNFLQGQTPGGLPLGKMNGILLMTMPNDVTLQVELQSGARCDANANYALTANATTFER